MQIPKPLYIRTNDGISGNRENQNAENMTLILKNRFSLWCATALLFCLAAFPLHAQYAGGQGLADELAEYARHQKRKVSVSRIYLQQVDSNGISSPTRRLMQSRRYDSQGRVKTDSIFHFEDGMPFMARRLSYESGRLVAAEEEQLSGEAPTTNRLVYQMNEMDILYLAVQQYGSGGADTTRYILDESGDIQYILNHGTLAGHSPDTTFCKVNSEGRLTETLVKGNPRVISRFTYNQSGQLILMTETLEYELLGHQERTAREFDYDKKGLLRSISDFDVEARLVSVFFIDYWNHKGKRIK